MLPYTNATVIVKSPIYDTDKYGVTKRTGFTNLVTVDADVQPVTSRYIKNTYGKDLESSFEVLTDFCDHIVKGNFIEINGIDYEIVELIPFMFDNMPGNIFDPICQFLVKRVD